MTNELLRAANIQLSHLLQNDAEFAKIYAFTKTRFDQATHLTGHNFEHARRDCVNAIAIGHAEGANIGIVARASILHDIGYLYGASRAKHGEVGADNVAEFLRSGDITLAQPHLAHIAACIRTHKGVMHGVVPETIEAKVVADADLLDKFGPVGVYQALLAFGEFGLDPADVIRRLTIRTKLQFLTTTGQQLVSSLRDYPSRFGDDLAAAYAPYLSIDQQEPS